MKESIFPTISRNNIKKIRSLKQKKYRDFHNQYLVEGENLCKAALASDSKIQDFIICPELLSTLLVEQWIKRLKRFNAPVYQCTPKEFVKITDTETPQGLLCIVEKNKPKDPCDLYHSPLLIALDSIQDPGNVGTIIRSADWFGASGILLNEKSVDVYNSKVVRSTAGALFHVPVYQNIDLKTELTELKTHGYKIFATRKDQGIVPKSITAFNNIVILFGNESKGIHPNLNSVVDAWVTIPGKGKTESLNVAISVAIILYEIKKDE